MFRHGGPRRVSTLSEDVHNTETAVLALNAKGETCHASRISREIFTKSLHFGLLRTVGDAVQKEVAPKSWANGC